MQFLTSATPSAHQNLWDSNTHSFSADMLKITAMITMLLDHIGAGVFMNLFHAGIFTSERTLAGFLYIYQILRLLGRIAFPVFCFLLVQGFLHTHSRLKYAGNLLIFALLSELPFDYLFYDTFTFSSQNVFWTLLIGLLTLWGIETIYNLKGNILLKDIAILLAAAAGVTASVLLRSDYSWMGILLIVCLYLFRKRPALQCTLSSILFFGSLTLRYLHNFSSLQEAVLYTFDTEWTVFLAFLMIYRCNGKRYIKGGKYFFYAFYPLHLILLTVLLKILLHIL